MGIQIACQMTFVSIGNAPCSIVVAVLRKFVLLLPLIYLLPHLLADQTRAVFLAEPVAAVIAVTGTVRLRESPNTKLATGEIEVVPEKIEVLGRCRYNALPFEINRSRDAAEALRLQYRYLALRNPAVKQNIILRCQVVAALRTAMPEHGFLEITTPILPASSPARLFPAPAPLTAGAGSSRESQEPLPAVFVRAVFE